MEAIRRVPRNRTCADHQRLWNGHCVDRKLEDSWLTELNSCRCMKLISICSGHADRLLRPPSLPHINMRLNAEYIPVMFSMFNVISCSMQDTLINVLCNDQTMSELHVSSKLIASRSMRTIRRDVVLHVNCRYARAGELPDAQVKNWFTLAIQGILALDDMLFDTLGPELPGENLPTCIVTPAG